MARAPTKQGCSQTGKYPGAHRALQQRGKLVSMAIVAGDRFDRLVALHQAESRGRMFWAFACDCGALVERPTSDVTRGKTKSCGCLKREQAAKQCPPEDLFGQRFGRLVVLRRLERSAGKSRWECSCDCGSIKVVAAADLRRGNTISCGCYRAERASAENCSDILGKRFGRLTARRKASSNDRGVVWDCRCSCGNTRQALAADLIGGRVISCGCAVRDKPGLSRPAVNARRVASNQARRAKLLGAGGRFTAAEIAALLIKQRGRCAWCTTKLNRFHRDHRKALSNSGDNFIRNIELLCPTCNMRKGAKDEIIWANENGKLL